MSVVAQATDCLFLSFRTLATPHRFTQRRVYVVMSMQREWFRMMSGTTSPMSQMARRPEPI